MSESKNSKRISLTQGLFAVVDAEDFEWLNQWKWQAHWNGRYWRAVRNHGRVFMHREILGLKHYDEKQVDHRNHNTLDNRRCNIRICTLRENILNQRKRKGCTSKYKGVHWKKKDRCWYVGITVLGRHHYIGRFENEIDAAKSYDIFAKKFFGEFAKLNFHSTSKRDTAVAV